MAQQWNDPWHAQGPGSFSSTEKGERQQAFPTACLEYEVSEGEGHAPGVSSLVPATKIEGRESANAKRGALKCLLSIIPSPNRKKVKAQTVVKGQIDTNLLQGIRKQCLCFFLFVFIKDHLARCGFP